MNAAEVNKCKADRSFTGFIVDLPSGREVDCYFVYSGMTFLVQHTVLAKITVGKWTIFNNEIYLWVY